MEAMAAGCAALSTLSPGDRVLVAEACTHHPSFDDIGRVKLPRWIVITSYSIHYTKLYE